MLLVKTRAVVDTTALAVTELPSGQNACCVRDDVTVDHGSLAWRDGRTLRVWSPEQGIIHSHAAAADRVVSTPTRPKPVGRPVVNPACARSNPGAKPGETRTQAV